MKAQTTVKQMKYKQDGKDIFGIGFSLPYNRDFINDFKKAVKGYQWFPNSRVWFAPDASAEAAKAVVSKYYEIV